MLRLRSATQKSNLKIFYLCIFEFQLDLNENIAARHWQNR